MSCGLHVHVGGGVERRTAYHEEQAAIREALESGTASTVVSGYGTTTTGSSLQDSGDYTGYPRCGASYRGAALGLLGKRGGHDKMHTQEYSF